MKILLDAQLPRSFAALMQRSARWLIALAPIGMQVVPQRP